MKTVIVQKRLWHTNSATHTGALRSSGSKRMCCLGFAARDAGCKDLTDRCFPNELREAEYEKFKKSFPKLSDSACYQLADINDNDLLTREQKAEKIQAEGRQYGVNFVFV